MKITYLSGTRADFGLMEASLKAINSDPDMSIEVVVTGQHFDSLYGNTIDDIVASGLTVRPLDPVPMKGETGIEMAHAVADQTRQVTDYLATQRPDLLLLLGDRGEMLAASIAATFLGIPVAHFHGGDRSGTVDDQLRQAITNLSHYHFPATPVARDRLLRMGEIPEHIHMLGAPGLDEIVAFRPDPTLRASLGIGVDEKLATVLFHPVVQDAALARAQAEELIKTLAHEFPGALVVLAPNSDAGSSQIGNYYLQAKDWIAQQPGLAARFIWVTHLPRTQYLSLLFESDLMVGNSSSGIIEAASLKTPVVNVGDRQNGRERNDSLFDCAVNRKDITHAIARAISYEGDFNNIYFQGGCAARLVCTIKSLNLSSTILKKKYTF